MHRPSRQVRRLTTLVLGLYLASAPSMAQPALGVANEGYGGVLYQYDVDAGCPSIDNPLQFVAVAPEQISSEVVLSEHLFRFYTYYYSGTHHDRGLRRTCDARRTAEMSFEAKVGGRVVATGRGRSVNGNMHIVKESVRFIDHHRLAGGADPLGKLLQLRASPSFRASLEHFETLKQILAVDQDATRQQFASMALVSLYQDAARSETTQEMRASHIANIRKQLQDATSRGHPAAPYLLSYELVEALNKLAAERERGEVGDLRPVQAKYDQYGRTFELSVQRRYIPAISLMQLLKSAGVQIVNGQIMDAGTPSWAELERALLARYAAASSASSAAISSLMGLPATNVLRCDNTWCYVPGGNKYRFSVDRQDCTESGAEKAFCSIIAHAVLINTFGGQTTTLTRGDGAARNQIELRMNLERRQRAWSIIGPIEAPGGPRP